MLADGNGETPLDYNQEIDLLKTHILIAQHNF